MAASTAGSTILEIIYCPNNEQRGEPSACQQELANRIEAFRVAHGAPAISQLFKDRDPQGRDVYGAILVV
jgi:hypothetical protein